MARPVRRAHRRYRMEHQHTHTEREPEALPVCREAHHHTDTTDALRTSLPSKGFFMGLSDFFKLFADPTRIRILMALDRAELCVCDLADLTGMTKSAVSHQLAALRQGHLVTYRREGKNVRYLLADEHVRQIIECASEHLNEAAF